MFHVYGMEKWKPKCATENNKIVWSYKIYWNNFFKYFQRAVLKFEKLYVFQHLKERKEMVAAKRQIVK
jgi:hypothetical protein